MDTTVIAMVRLVHVLSGVFWVGSVVMLTVFLTPAVRAVGSVGGAVMHQLMEVQRFAMYLIVAAGFSIGSGGLLYWHDSGGFSPAWVGSNQGICFGIGGILAVLGAMVGILINKPASERMGAVALAIREAGGPPSAELTAELQALQARLTVGTIANVTFLVGAAGAMAVARYLV